MIEPLLSYGAFRGQYSRQCGSHRGGVQSVGPGDEAGRPLRVVGLFPCSELWLCVCGAV